MMHFFIMLGVIFLAPSLSSKPVKGSDKLQQYLADEHGHDSDHHEDDYHHDEDHHYDDKDHHRHEDHDEEEGRRHRHHEDEDDEDHDWW